MNPVTYRFSFEPDVSMENIDLTWQMAVYAGEGLFSPAQIELDVQRHRDNAARRLEMTGPAEVMTPLVRVFVSLLIREIGQRKFKAQRLHNGVETSDTRWQESS